ncbi:sigma-54 dependent transcriptional regulator [Novosphingobium resinovorum]|uniref:DNA-binding transcriptional regulator NtrC n=1 Tax=Novosphingobium resinovorum TaxID=158500 RepID=A0A1D8A1T4_9SPHN|nr:MULTISPECIES: sigma-54 dependent transcriptional regulator [Sphingomonadaceae]AOR76054.1 nitrogen regulation protein NR(I) [Novosphingobium resinovorum]EJU14109.1 two-component system NtrC family nitrogen regulation response regulator GlnG [Sphingomonas sp. LH128]MBF7011436.1 sigma-54-dependent Fis family transcriptional regulator [Novosphingobium sp. HR1a]WJM29414.1 sigma-54 dependent transcriptional regulator [Novosphingobium resinovorum]
MTQNVLLVEDDMSIAIVITAALEAEGFGVSHCVTIAERDRMLADRGFAALVTDVMLPDGDGIETIERVRALHPHMPIVILSAQNTLDTAVRATDTGAFEYFPKPFDIDELARTVRQAAGTAQGLAADGEEPVADGLPLVGRSAAMQSVFRMITRVLRNDLTVLILGESGTGKELVAEAIHQLGNRREGPFIAVNTAAIPAELIESELFGHEKGAFTGAVARHVGKFEQAAGGTLFLDEIGDMPMQAQTRLLRALQSGTVRRVGGREEIRLDTRIVAATNKDLEPEIAAGRFREDLYYRLNVVPIHMPPLRDRRDDIDVLARHFLQHAANEGLPRRQLTKEAADLLSRQPWRGNVRELKNFIYRLALLAREDVIDAEAVLPLLTQEAPPPAEDGGAPRAVDIATAVSEWLAVNRPPSGSIYNSAMAAFERPLFAEVLRETAGNQLRAAQALGINRNTLRKRLGELALDPEEFARRP